MTRLFSGNGDPISTTIWHVGIILERIILAQTCRTGGSILNRSDTWKTWVIVIGLLIFTGLASAAFLWYSSQEESQTDSEVAAADRETEPITIRVGEYVLGDELLGIPFISENIEGVQINPWLVVIASFVVVAALVGGIGLFLALLSMITSRQVSKVYADEGFHASVATLSQHDKESLQGKQETRPVATAPAPERRLRWSLITSALLIVILVWAAGLVYGVAFFGDTTWNILGAEVSAVSFINLLLVITTIAIIAVTIRAHEPGGLDSSKTDNNPVSWNYVWIILSGALILGIGAGLAIMTTTITGS